MPLYRQSQIFDRDGLDIDRSTLADWVGKSTALLEPLNGEIKRRTDVVGIAPNDAAIVQLVGALLLEQNDEWAVQRVRYMTLETMAPLSVRQGIGPRTNS